MVVYCNRRRTKAYRKEDPLYREVVLILRLQDYATRCGALEIRLMPLISAAPVIFGHECRSCYRSG